jgi:hypothetical protein
MGADCTLIEKVLKCLAWLKPEQKWLEQKLKRTLKCKYCKRNDKGDLSKPLERRGFSPHGPCFSKNKMNVRFHCLSLMKRVNLQSQISLPAGLKSAILIFSRNFAVRTS